MDYDVVCIGVTRDKKKRKNTVGMLQQKNRRLCCLFLCCLYATNSSDTIFLPTETVLVYMYRQR